MEKLKRDLNRVLWFLTFVWAVQMLAFVYRMYTQEWDLAMQAFAPAMLIGVGIRGLRQTRAGINEKVT